MKLIMHKYALEVIKEPGDPRFSGIVNAAGESRLLYHIKKQLNAQGFDLIKKHCCKDGHLMDSYQQYLRTRKPSGGDPEKDIYIYSGFFAIEGADAVLNRTGTVTFSIERDVFNAEKKMKEILKELVSAVDKLYLKYDGTRNNDVLNAIEKAKSALKTKRDVFNPPKETQQKILSVGAKDAPHVLSPLKG